MNRQRKLYFAKIKNLIEYLKDVYNKKDIIIKKQEFIISKKKQDDFKKKQEFFISKKEIDEILEKYFLYFENKSGKSISEGLYKDILNWEKWRKGEKLNTIEITRIFERMNKEFKEKLDKEFTLQEVGLKNKGPWYDVFETVSPQLIAYIRSMRINGEDLRLPPRVKLSTIHGAKGGEADNIALLQDQTSNTLKASKKSTSKQDEENRVWYVAVTRAKQNLFLIRGKDRRKEYRI